MYPMAATDVPSMCTNIPAAVWRVENLAFLFFIASSGTAIQYNTIQYIFWFIEKKNPQISYKSFIPL